MSDNALALADHFYDIGRYEAALDALKSDPLVVERAEDLPKNVLMVDVLLACGETEDARHLAEQLLSVYPDDPFVKEAFIGVCVRFRELAAVGSSICQAMISADGENPRLWFLLAKLGFSYRTVPDDLVVEASKKAVEFGGDEPNILAVSHLLLLNLGCAEAAELCVRRLAEMSPDSDATYESIAHHFANVGYFRELGEVCLDGLAAYPQNQVLQEYVGVVAERFSQSPLIRVLHWPITAVQVPPTSLPRWGEKLWHRVQYYWWHARARILPILALVVVLPVSVVVGACLSHHLVVNHARSQFRLRQVDDLYRRLVAAADVRLEDAGDGWLFWNPSEDVEQNVLRVTPHSVAFARHKSPDPESLLLQPVAKVANRRNQVCKLEWVDRWNIRDNEVEMIPRFRAPGKARQKVILSDPESVQSLEDWLGSHGFQQTRSAPLEWWKVLGRAVIVIPMVTSIAIAFLLIGQIWSVAIGLIIAANLIDRVYHSFRYRPLVTVYKRQKKSVSNERPRNRSKESD